MEGAGASLWGKRRRSINRGDYLTFPASFVVGTIYDNEKVPMSTAPMLMTTMRPDTSPLKAPWG